MLNSLIFHVTGTLLLLLLAFAGTTSYTFLSIKQQRNNDVILAQAARLELAAQYLANQAMRYKEHAPRDYASYHRDLDLYYQDLMEHVETFDTLSNAFMSREFQPNLTEMKETLQPDFGGDALTAVRELDRTWQDYRRELFEALGPDSKGPRLEWGAEYVLDHNPVLANSARHLQLVLKDWSSEELQRIKRINLAVITGGLLVATVLAGALYVWVLVPLRRTQAGFELAAHGDFGVSVPEQGCREAVSLTRSFNHLSSRLHTLFYLIEQLQAGSDLDELLGCLAGEFRELLRLDWIGVYFVTMDGLAVRLETGYLDGQPESTSKSLYALADTPLADVLGSKDPMHIGEADVTSGHVDEFDLLTTLRQKGMRDVLFLPLSEQSQSPEPGFVVFAARNGTSYDPEQLRLLNNIAQLIIHSFGRTARFAANVRLAAIGTFVAGIVHELRTPLATVGMALEHVQDQRLSLSGTKRVDLAIQETGRMGRLLEEMLLYARPLRLRPLPMDLATWLNELVHRSEQSSPRAQRIVLKVTSITGWIIGDADRLTQVFENLNKNAADAAPAGATITWSIRPCGERIMLCVHNPGPPIDQTTIPRLTEPFFTTKTGGTGLGLAIVQRIVDAHGGELQIQSGTTGTRICVTFPQFYDRSEAPQHSHLVPSPTVTNSPHSNQRSPSRSPAQQHSPPA